MNQEADADMLDWETATASVVAPIPETAPVEDLSGNRTPVSPNPMPYLQTTQTTSEPIAGAEAIPATNMVLFVSSLRQVFSSIW